MQSGVALGVDRVHVSAQIEGGSGGAQRDRVVLAVALGRDVGGPLVALTPVTRNKPATA